MLLSYLFVGSDVQICTIVNYWKDYIVLDSPEDSYIDRMSGSLDILNYNVPSEMSLLHN